MKKFGLAILVLFALAAAPADASVVKAQKIGTKGKPVVQECNLVEMEGPCTVPLIAGQNTVVGEVVVDLTSDEAVVTFSITNSGWMITESHVYLGEEPPEKSAPGSFPFKHSGLFTDSDEYFRNEIEANGEIDLETCLYVAVHAVVEKDCVEVADLAAVSQTISTINDFGTVQLNAQFTGDDGESYWNLEVSGGGTLDGTYPGWCVDLSNVLGSGGPYDAEVYSSYDELPDYIKDRVNPAQLDMVNFILNQEWACDAIGIQNAIWAALGQLDPATLEGCALEIFNQAEGASGGFIPPCGGVVGVIIAPEYNDGTGQILIGQILTAELDVFECTTTTECGHETAWGLANTENSCQFPKGTGWGTYFKCGSCGCSTDECIEWQTSYEILMNEMPDGCTVPENN